MILGVTEIYLFKFTKQSKQNMVITPRLISSKISQKPEQTNMQGKQFWSLALQSKKYNGKKSL